MQAYPRRHLSSSCSHAVLSLLLIARMQAKLHSSACPARSGGLAPCLPAAYCKQRDSRGANAGGCKTLTTTTDTRTRAKPTLFMQSGCTQLAAFRQCRSRACRGAKQSCSRQRRLMRTARAAEATLFMQSGCTQLAAYRQRRSRACRGAQAKLQHAKPASAHRTRGGGNALHPAGAMLGLAAYCKQRAGAGIAQGRVLECA
jgi:hypothetical protein